MKSQLLLFISMLATLIGSLGLANNASLLPVNQADLHKPSIYAYKDWQSVGIMLNPGDLVKITAQGSWFYTPHEYHGANGHPVYLAPDFYPLPYGPGGALIGRIGEEGMPFVVGEETRIDDYTILAQNSLNASRADATNAGGMLYLRINDDILSDNDGAMTVEIEVTRVEKE